MTEKEKIRAEIERIRKSYQIKYQELDYTSPELMSVCAKRNLCQDILMFIDSMQEEPKECMFTRDYYTDEDRKALCEGCEEKCKFNKKQEPVSEDLNTVAKEFANNITEKIGYRLQLRRAVCFGANWKKEQLIANSVDATVHIDAGGYPYIQQMELYDYDKDIPLAKEGDKYKVILIKKD